MNKIFLILLFLQSAVCYTQEAESDTLSETNIEGIIFNDKDYGKIEYSYGLKQEINSRFIPIVNSEMGLKFKNELNKKGRMTAVRLFLHKTDSEFNLTTLEITFYRIDSMTKLPLQKLNKEKIIYTPKTKRRETVRIDLKNYNLPFPEKGVLVAVRWMPTATRNQNVGPSLRQT